MQDACVDFWQVVGHKSGIARATNEPWAAFIRHSRRSVGRPPLGTVMQHVAGPGKCRLHGSSPPNLKSLHRQKVDVRGRNDVSFNSPPALVLGAASVHPSSAASADRQCDSRQFLFVIRNAKQSRANFMLRSCTILSTLRGRGVAPDDCPNCGGTGYVAKPVDLNGKSDGVAFIRLKCPACRGTGRKHPIPPTTAG